MTGHLVSDQYQAGQAGRHKAILDRISGTGSVAVSEMADLLGVSEATIRRDLDHLATRRLVERTHGGALAYEGLPGPRRGRRHVHAIFQAAAAAVAERCEGVCSLAITGTGLGELVAQHLASRNVSVLTNVIDVATALGRSQSVELVVTGGFRHPGSAVLAGAMAEAAAAAFHLDLVFVSADGVSTSAISIADPGSARVAAVMVARARRVLVACPPDALGADTFGDVCNTNLATEILTWSPGPHGETAPPRQLRALADLGMVVTVIGHPQDGEP